MIITNHDLVLKMILLFSRLEMPFNKEIHILEILLIMTILKQHELMEEAMPLRRY
jgi:hypothetical protein